MAKMNKYLILDTETTTFGFVNEITSTADEKKNVAIARPLIYDIGYVIINTKGEVLKRVNYLVKEIWAETDYFKNAYYAWKKPLYEKMLKKGTITVKPWLDILKELETDLQDIKFTSAFNACFDFKKALPTTSDFIYHRDYKQDFNKWLAQQKKICAAIATKKYLGKNPEYLKPYFTIFKKNYPLVDLWGLACERLVNNNNFKRFCLKNQKYTNSVQYFSTSAETVYQYLKKDIEFNEEHTALSDAEIEAEILAAILKKGKVELGEIKAFPFRGLGYTTDFVKHSPKYRNNLIKAMKKYLQDNNAYEKLNNGYWCRLVEMYENL